MEYTLSEIKKDDKKMQSQMNSLLTSEGISVDANLDYSLGLFDENMSLVATGSCFKNTLRCFAVDKNHQGEGLLNQIVTALIDYEYSKNNTHLFLYTKIESSKFFNDLGFSEIARVDGKLVFMENKKSAFTDYLENLSKSKKDGKCSSIVMNANPFTFGHRHLLEKASRENDFVHLFVVSEDMSEIPFKDRFDLVKKGISDLENVILHESGSYIISSATFPSYFLKDSNIVASSHAKLDAIIFERIADALNIKSRYIGKEPFSETTKIYNNVLKDELPKTGIDVIEIDRLEIGGEIVSASVIRNLIKKNDLDSIKKLVPPSTFDYIKFLINDRL